MNVLLAIMSMTLVTAAAVCDSKSHRIPNWLTYGGLVAALAVQALSHGLSGIGLAFSGAAVAGSLLLPLWFLGGLAAGDVKLMTAVGAYLGPAAACLATLAALIAGGAFAMASIVRSKTASADPATVRSMPYAPAIAVGTAVTYLLAWFQAH